MGTRLGTKLGTRLAASTVWLLLLLGPDTRSAKAGSGTDDAGVDERPSLLIVRSLAPWQEPLYPALTANDRWFCASAARLRCRHRTWLSLPPGREEYHPWFSRFHLAAHALEVAAEHADVVLWLDHDAVFSASAAQVEERLLAWLPGRLERTPLLLAVSNEKGDPVNTPKAFFAANVSAARRVLAALSDYLPREDKPLVPNAKRGSVGTLLHAYAWAGEERAAQFGTAGQLELLEKQQPALATLVGRLPASSVAQDAWLGEGGCALPLPPDWAATAAAVAGEPPAAGELPAEQRPFIASFSCGGEDVAGVVLLARLLRAHNTALGVPPPSAAELAIGGTVVAAADAADRGEAPVDQPPGSTPTLLLIVYGEEYARTRTPVFVRSLLAARTTALHLYVLCDPDGLRAFRLRHVSAMPSLLDPSCHTGGYAYLFYKLFTPELLPAADHLLVIDSDAIF
ncbi:hypothetical protein T492DRAFT_848938 [Pavlovales sp. CCMP2436]|nr:hypothetical protein T492DRAFT_848938 [Pavlovales sp. CCMP2436]